MRPISVSVSSATTSSVVPLDINKNPFNVGIGVVSSGTATYKVQHTFDNPDSSPTWFDHDELTAKTTSDDGNYAFPVRAVRLNVTAYTSGTVTMTVIQAGL